jgi:DNA replication protein DnaC
VSEIVRARVEERLTRLRLGSVASRLDAILAQAARKEPTYLDFLDEVLGDEFDAKQKKRVAMGIQIAHFPTVKLLEEFDFKFQPSVDQRLVRELATGRERRQEPDTPRGYRDQLATPYVCLLPDRPARAPA